MEVRCLWGLGLWLLLVEVDGVGGLLAGFLDAFGFQLLVGKAALLAGCLGEQGLVFGVVGVFVVDDIGNFFTEESVEWLHRSIGGVTNYYIFNR